MSCEKDMDAAGCPAAYDGCGPVLGLQSTFPEQYGALWTLITD